MHKHVRALFGLSLGLLLSLATLGRADDAPPTKADLQKSLDNYIGKKPPEWKQMENLIDDKVAVLDFMPAPDGAHTVKVGYTLKNNKPLTDFEKLTLDLSITVLVKNALTGQGGVFDKEQGMAFKERGKVIAVPSQKEGPAPDVGNAEKERQRAEEERKRNEIKRQRAEAERLRNEKERQRQIQELRDLLRRIQLEQRNRATRQSTDGYYSLVVAPSRLPTVCGPYGSFVYVWVPLDRDSAASQELKPVPDEPDGDLNTKRNKSAGQGVLTSRHRDKKTAEEAEVYFRRGCAKFKAGNYREARQDFEAAIALNAQDARYWYHKGLTEVELRRPQPAPVLQAARRDP